MKFIPIQPVADASRSAASGWHLRWLLAAPHRLGFFAAALMLAGTALWWATVLLARAGA